MKIDMLVRLVVPCLTIALAISVGGLVVGMMTDIGRSSGAEVTVAASNSPKGDAAAANLESQLEAIHNTIGIQPSQDGAWRNFVRTMLQLSQEGSDYRRRLTSGEHFDETMERARHILIFGAAMSEFEKNLSPEQVVVARSLAGDLTASYICKGLPPT